MKKEHEDLKKNYATLKHKSQKNYKAYNNIKSKCDSDKKDLEKEKIESVQDLKKQVDTLKKRSRKIKKHCSRRRRH